MNSIVAKTDTGRGADHGEMRLVSNVPQGTGPI